MLSILVTPMFLLTPVCYSHNNTFQTCFIFFFFFFSPNSSCCTFFEFQASSNNRGVGGRKGFKLHLLWRQMCLEDHEDVLQFLLPVKNRISETLQLTSHQMMIITKRERERERERERGREGFVRRFYIPREREGFIRRFYIPSRDAWGPRNPSCFTCETCSVVLHCLCVRACGQTG